MSDVDPFAYFLDEGLITSVVRPIKSGKEASVVLCRVSVDAAVSGLAALKIFSALDRRDFRDESVYREGEWIPDARARRALANRSNFGRQVQAGTWSGREWEALRLLHASGVPVPRPIARSDDAILMDYVGDEVGAAPPLRAIRPNGAAEAEPLLDQVVAAAGAMLRHNLVHGDLSPYNVLVWDGQVTVIDLPQAVDARHNPNALDLLRRDLVRMCQWASRYGVERSGTDIAAELWSGWQYAGYVPDDLRWP